jgi:hypothetical protein
MWVSTGVVMVNLELCIFVFRIVLVFWSFHVGNTFEIS